MSPVLNILVPIAIGSVASLNIQNLYFSYRYCSIFVGRIVDVFSQLEVIGKHT
jgi:hypothetical protein